MTVLVADRIERPLTLFGDAEAQRRGPAATRDVAAPAPRDGRADRGGLGGEPTLDDLVVGAWEGLAAQAAAACPICDEGTLRPTGRAGHGRCDRCGTTLS